MKETFFLIIAILYCLICNAQQTVAISDVVNINLPGRAEKITKEQAMSHATKKFKYDKMKLNSIADRHADIYKIDDILVSLHSENNSFKKGHLLELKKGEDEFFKGDTSYRSSLKEVNNNSVLIVNYIRGNIKTYDFFCYNASNSSAIAGTLEFDKADVKKAETILNQLIKSIKFTE